MTRGSKAPDITITSEALHAIRGESLRSLGGLETGGILLGKDSLEDGPTVLVAGLPGPNAIRRPRFFSRDREHAQRLADVAWARDRAQWIGEWHTHPGGMPVPSEADLTSYAGHLADPDLNFDRFFSLIVTVPATGSPSTAAWTIERHRARLSFLRIISMKEPS